MIGAIVFLSIIFLCAADDLKPFATTGCVDLFRVHMYGGSPLQGLQKEQFRFSVYCISESNAPASANTRDAKVDIKNLVVTAQRSTSRIWGAR